ncbi:DUF6895 family protein [Vibrio mediterranei]
MKIKKTIVDKMSPFTSEQEEITAAILIVRLVYHGDAISSIDDFDKTYLLKWSFDIIEPLIESCDRMEADDIELLSSVDFFSLIYAASILKHYKVDSRLFESINSLVSRLGEHDSLLVGPDEKEFFYSLYNHAYNIKPQKSMSIGNILQSTEADYSPLNVLKLCLISSEFGSESIQGKIDDRRTLSSSLDLLLLSSIRMRDNTAAVHAIVSMNILGADISTDAISWLNRLKRNDGLIGTWDLFFNQENNSRLRSTVDVYFALHSCKIDKLALFPSNKKTMPNDGRLLVKNYKELGESCDEKSILFQWEDLVNESGKCFSWLLENIHRFRLAPGVENKEDFSDRIKQFVEIVIILDIVKNFEYEGGFNPFSEAALTLSDCLKDHLNWEGLVEGIRLYPSTVLASLYLPMMENIYQEKSLHHKEIAEIVNSSFSNHLERTPMRQMDYEYLKERIGLDSDIESKLTETLLFGLCSPSLFASDSVYDITHTIFYATRFGKNSISHFPKSVSEWIEDYIPKLAASTMLESDSDLGSELILVSAYSDLKFDGNLSLALSILKDRISNNGTVKGPFKSERSHLDEFEQCYHTTLVALAAIVESVSRWCPRAVMRKIKPISISNEKWMFFFNYIESVISLDAKIDSEIIEGKSHSSCRLLISGGSKGWLSIYKDDSAYADTLIFQKKAYEIGVSPQIIDYSESTLESNMEIKHVISEYISGGTLGESKKHDSLERKYYILGELLGRLHSVNVPKNVYDEAPHRDLNKKWILLVEKFINNTELVGVYELLFNNPTSTKILHGDTHVENVVGLEQPKLIDFEHSGFGMPELDLGLAISYVNTNESERVGCLSSILSGYKKVNPNICTEKVRAAAVLAPIYCAGIEIIRSGEESKRDAINIALDQSQKIFNALIENVGTS